MKGRDRFRGYAEAGLISHFPIAISRERIYRASSSWLNVGKMTNLSVIKGRDLEMYILGMIAYDGATV